MEVGRKTQEQSFFLFKMEKLTLEGPIICLLPENFRSWAAGSTCRQNSMTYYKVLLTFFPLNRPFGQGYYSAPLIAKGNQV